MNRFVMRRFATLLYLSGLLAMPMHSIASGFQLWEQDGASVGNYHAGYAAEANDASTAWYNPAGIPRIKNQQVVGGGSGIWINFKYKGNVGVTESIPTVAGFEPVTVTIDSISAQGGTNNFVPFLSYVAPINDWIGFGFSVGAPFGLKTDYNKDSALRYAATLTSIKVIDISPSLGLKISDKAYIGFGLDIQRAYAEFNKYSTLIDLLDETTIDTTADTYSKNTANDTGYGFHLGFLYEFTPCTRVGISYHSQVVHHLSGTSRFEGPIADIVNDDAPLVSSRATANIKLPPYTSLSVFNKITPNWAVMGTLNYTQWNTFKTLSMNQAAGAVPSDISIIAPSTNISVNVPENYRNTLNLSLGANYYPTDTIIVRAGVGYDQSPARNAYRNVQLPDGDRYAIAFGGHYQATKTIGLDVGYTHIFFNEVKIHPPAVVIGAETTSTNGRVNGSADVLSGQVTWDMF